MGDWGTWDGDDAPPGCDQLITIELIFGGATELGSTPGNREVEFRLGFDHYTGSLRRLEKKRQRERARISLALIAYLLHLDGH